MRAYIKVTTFNFRGPRSQIGYSHKVTTARWFIRASFSAVEVVESIFALVAVRVFYCSFLITLGRRHRSSAKITAVTVPNNMYTMQLPYLAQLWISSPLFTAP